MVPEHHILWVEVLFIFVFCFFFILGIFWNIVEMVRTNRPKNKWLSFCSFHISDHTSFEMFEVLVYQHICFAIGRHFFYILKCDYYKRKWYWFPTYPIMVIWNQTESSLLFSNIILIDPDAHVLHLFYRERWNLFKYFSSFVLLNISKVFKLY